MLLDDSHGDGKSEPCASCFSREEWIEQPFLHGWRDSRTGVYHLEDDVSLTLCRGISLLKPRPQFNPSTPLDAFSAVTNQVDQDLFHLGWISVEADCICWMPDCEFDVV